MRYDSKSKRAENRFNGRSDSEEEARTEVEADSSEETAEPRTHRPSLASLLVESGTVSDGQLRDALAQSRESGERLGEIVVHKGWASDEQIAELLAEQWQLRFLRADALAFDPLAMRRIRPAIARELDAVPIGFEAQGILVAIAEPSQDLFTAVSEHISDAAYVVIARSALDSLLRSRMFADDPADVARKDAAQDAESDQAADAADQDAAPGTESELPAEALREDAAAAPYASTESEDDEKIAPAILPGGPAEPRPDGAAAAAFASIDTAAGQLTAVRREVSALAAALERAEATSVEQQGQLEAAERARTQDGQTIRELEAELARRGELFATLEQQVTSLTETLAGARSPARDSGETQPQG